MSDLVERLRNEAEFSEKAALDYQAYSSKTVLMEAANEIERLQRELTEARRKAFIEAAEIVSNFESPDPLCDENALWSISRQAAEVLRAKAEETQQ